MPMVTVDLTITHIMMSTCLSNGLASPLEDRSTLLPSRRCPINTEARRRTSTKHHAGFPRAATSLFLRYLKGSRMVTHSGVRSIVLISLSVAFQAGHHTLRPLPPNLACILHILQDLEDPTNQVLDIIIPQVLVICTLPHLVHLINPQMAQRRPRASSVPVLAHLLIRLARRCPTLA
jgi:hypothetical protein